MDPWKRCVHPEGGTEDSSPRGHSPQVHTSAHQGELAPPPAWLRGWEAAQPSETLLFPHLVPPPPA